MNNFYKLAVMACLCIASFSCVSTPEFSPNTEVSIVGEDFYINGKPTYAGVEWEGNRVEGLLLNSRMVQGIFDDENPETATRWVYPDDSTWSADRNTQEFIAAMDEWAAYGLNSFTINLQGGSPMGYGNKNWENTTFDKYGQLKPEYIKRLSAIIDRADELNMVVILGYFYFGQDQYLKDEEAVINATKNATNWILAKGYANVIVEVANECDIEAYDHPIIMVDRIHELIKIVKSSSKDGRRLLVSTSYAGNRVPKQNVVQCADFLLVHGNGIEHPEGITQLIQQTKSVIGYHPMPIVFNEDDHYDFEQEHNNFAAAIQSHVSWGYFDFRQDGEAFENGFQSVPVDWRVNSPRKLGFFNMVKQISGR